MAETFTLTTDGSTALGKLQPRTGSNTNNKFFMNAVGTFDGATISLQYSLDAAGTTKVDVDAANLNFTASKRYGFYVSGDVWYWLTVSNDGASTDVDVIISRCDGEY